MNILHINKEHFMGNGADMVYLKTSELLETHGHRSFFFSMHHPDNLICETSSYFLPNVNLNIKHGLFMQFKIAGRILYSFMAKKKLAQLLDDYSIDVAHLHNIYHQISPSILHELKKRGIPTVMTLHDFKLVCASYLLYANDKPCEACSGGRYFMTVKKRCVKDSLAKSMLAVLEMYLHHKVLKIYDHVDIFISPSLFLQRKLFEMGFKKNIVYLPNFFDVKTLDANKGSVQHTDTSRKYSLLYVGRLSREKGLFTLLETAKLLLHERKNLEIRIIGDGPMRKKLQAKVEEGHISNVKFFGYLDRSDLYEELKKSLAVILPSEWYENNPLAVIEAFASGKPVVAARIGGITELVKDYERGLTFNPGDPEDMADKIRILLDNIDKARAMGENGRIYVDRELNADRYYDKLLEIYNQAIQKVSRLTYSC